MDCSGQLVELPHDLTLPFARFISRSPAGMGDVKRFVFDRVYRQNIVGGQPRHVYECDFDIVKPFYSMLDEVEVLKVGCEVLQESAEFLIIKVNHASVLTAIFNHSRIPSSQHVPLSSLLQLLSSISWIKVKNQITAELGLDSKQIDALGAFVGLKGDFTSISSKLCAVLSKTNLTKSLDSLKKIIDLFQSKTKNRKVHFPL